MTRILPALMLLSGCGLTDPFLRPGMWQPEGANAANMALMVAHPAELVRGHIDARPVNRTGQDAVVRQWEGRSRPLLDRPAPTAESVQDKGRS